MRALLMLAQANCLPHLIILSFLMPFAYLSLISSSLFQTPSATGKPSSLPPSHLQFTITCGPQISERVHDATLGFSDARRLLCLSFNCYQQAVLQLHLRGVAHHGHSCEYTCITIPAHSIKDASLFIVLPWYRNKSNLRGRSKWSIGSWEREKRM